MAFKSYPRNQAAIESDGKENLVLSLKAGTTTIRVMPAYSEKGCWFKKINEYYFRIGDQHLYFPSPRDFGESDPIWDFCEELFENGEEGLVAKAKDWRPKLRYMVNAFILAEPTSMERNNISVLKIPAKVQKELRTYDVDSAAGYGDITNVESGINFNIKKEGKGLGTTYSVAPHRENSNIKELLKARNLDLDTMELHNLDTAYTTKSTQEIIDILEYLKSQLENKPTELPITGGTDPQITVVGDIVSGEVVVEAPPQK